MTSAKVAILTKEIATVVKRNLGRLEKMATKFFFHALKFVANTNGDLTKKRRDEYAEGLVQFITDNWKDIFDPILAKIDRKVKDVDAKIYKENANWTEIFVVFNMSVDNEEIHTGAVFSLVVRDIFVEQIDKAVLAEIINDTKRPKKYYHFQTIKAPV